MPEATTQRLLPAKAAAAYLGLGERKLWELGNRGDIPTVRIGRRVLYDVRDLDDFVTARKRKGFQ